MKTTFQSKSLSSLLLKDNTVALALVFGPLLSLAVHLPDSSSVCRYFANITDTVISDDSEKATRILKMLRWKPRQIKRETYERPVARRVRRITGERVILEEEEEYIERRRKPHLRNQLCSSRSEEDCSTSLRRKIHWGWSSYMPISLTV